MLLLLQGDPKKTEPNSNYSKYTGSVFFGSPCTTINTLWLGVAELSILAYSCGMVTQSFR